MLLVARTQEQKIFTWEGIHYNTSSKQFYLGRHPLHTTVLRFSHSLSLPNMALTSKLSESKVELTSALDFPRWNRECRRLAMRGGLLPLWEQQLVLHPLPLAPAAVPVAKRDAWQRFRADLEAAVKSEPEQHPKTLAPAVLEAMNPAQLFCELRDNGNGGVGFGTASYDQQVAEKLDLEGDEFKYHLQSMKPHGFINALLEKMDRLP